MEPKARLSKQLEPFVDPIRSQKALDKAIGSVLPTSVLPSAPVSGNILDLWTQGQVFCTYRTARAALAAVLQHRGIRTIWLPSYVCGAVVEGVDAVGAEIKWYVIHEDLSIDLNSLDPQAGEAVLIVDYFGKSADTAVRAMVRDRREVLWIEDRAQALNPDYPAFGDMVLYSPRKLFGVADGGLVVGADLPQIEAVQDDSLWQANDGRARDPDGLDPSGWFDAFRTRERGFNTAPAAMDDRTLDALFRLNPEAEIAARRTNWQVLATHLADIALWPDRSVEFVPLAYPVVVDDAEALSRYLTAGRIWCARHWAHLPSPEGFSEAHNLAGRLVSLPLDGRYDEADMLRIVAAIRGFI